MHLFLILLFLLVVGVVIGVPVYFLSGLFGRRITDPAPDSCREPTEEEFDTTE